MAESYVPQNNEGAALVGVSRTQRLWVLGLLLSAVAAVASWHAMHVVACREPVAIDQ